MSIGEKIKQFRKEKGMTQKELGDKCGIADSAIRRYELGGANPKLVTLEKIAIALEVNVFDIMDFNSTIDMAYKILDNSTSLEHLDLAEKIGNIAKQKYQEKFPLDIQLLVAFDDLNDHGRQKAVEQVEMLTKVPEYRKDHDNTPTGENKPLKPD